MTFVSEFVHRYFPHAKVHGAQWQARCPAHEDAKASLSIARGEDGRVLLRCFAGCDAEAIVAAKGLRMADLFVPRDAPAAACPTPCRMVAEYIYERPDGTPSFMVVRYEPKDFRQFAADGTGGWLPKKGAAEDVVYRLPHLHGKRSVVIVEGEKDVDRLEALGLPATCNAGGASKWKASHADQLCAAGVQTAVLIPDNDAPGRAHMHAVAASLRARDIAVQWLELPNLPPKGDVSDALAGGLTKEALVQLLKDAPAFVPPPSGTATAPVPDERVQQELLTLKVRREARRLLDADQRGPILPAETLTLAAWLAQPDEPQRYRIADLQPTDSRVVLVAQFKSGKTTLVDNNLVPALVDGGRFLGRFDVVPVTGRVCVLDFEMSETQLKAWLRHHHIVRTDAVIVQSLRGHAARFNILDPEVRQAWAGWLRAHEVQYLIVDCLRPILDALGLDENHDAGQFLVALDALLADAGVPEALLVHHMGHTAERSRGDSRLRDYPDVEWRLVRQDGNPASPRFFTAYGRDVDVPECALAFDKATRRLVVSGGSRQVQKAEVALGDVLALLRDAPKALSTVAIETTLGEGHAREAVRAALRLGIDRGQIGVCSGAHNATLHRLTSTIDRQFASSPPPIEGGELASCGLDSREEFSSPFGELGVVDVA